jgi:hypothetical protein
VLGARPNQPACHPQHLEQPIDGGLGRQSSTGPVKVSSGTGDRPAQMQHLLP